MPYDLLQDSARTWLILDDQDSSNTTISELQLTGNGHLAIANNGTRHTSLQLSKMTGDFTATLHVGRNQSVSVHSMPNSILSASIFAYQVMNVTSILLLLLILELSDLNYVFNNK